MERQNFESLQKRIDELTRRAAETDKKEAAVVRRAVADASASYTFRDRQSRTDFLTLVSNSISVDEDGVLSGSDGSTIEEVIRAEYERRPRWHGEPRSSPTAAAKPSDADDDFDFNSVHAGMSEAELERFRLAIVKALPDSWKHLND